jgi:hypothetical protein
VIDARIDHSVADGLQKHVCAQVSMLSYCASANKVDAGWDSQIKHVPRTLATMYSVSSTDSRCSLSQMSRSEMREYARQIIRTPVLSTLCRSLHAMPQHTHVHEHWHRR